MTAGIQKIPHIHYIHAFRGFAILCIVSAHIGPKTFRLFTESENPSIAYRVFFGMYEPLFHDSTLFFSLISGLLFTLVLAQKGWHSFFRSKIQNVIFPFIFISILFTFFNFSVDSVEIWSGDGFRDFAHKAFQNIYTGGAMFHLWYMPVLAILFIATPLLYSLLTHARSNWFIVLIVILPLFFSRTGPGFNWVNSIYFMGAYAAGMYMGLHLNKTVSLIENNKLLLRIIAVVTTAILIFMPEVKIEYFGDVSIKESVFYVQKMAITAVILVWLKHNEAVLPRWLDVLADYAFAVYFLHIALFYSLVYAMSKVIETPLNLGLVVILNIVFLFAVLALCVFIAWLIKKATRRRSRMIIGA